MEIAGFRHQTSRILLLRINFYGNELWLLCPNDSNRHSDAHWQARHHGVELCHGVHPLAVDRGDHIADVYVPRLTWALSDRDHQYPLSGIKGSFLLHTPHPNLQT